MTSPSSLRLRKHHGLGNDFLVLLDPDGVHAGGADLARHVCDRHRGVGADGLLHALPRTDGADLTMKLHNADGSEAEMSGNGIRCLVQAAVDAGWVTTDEVAVATGGGVRRVRIGEVTGPGERSLSVDMGAVLVKDDATEWVAGPVRRATRASIGNPHLVLLVDDPAAIGVAEFGERVHTSAEGPVNVEWIRVDDEHTITLRVYERGAGETQACGTGSCASAVVAHGWGLVGTSVTVRNPGGDVRVDIDEHAGTVWLTGPAQHIATVELPWPVGQGGDRR